MNLELAIPLIACLAFPRAPVSAPPSRILFIGNSYTYCNALPELLGNMVASTGLPAPVTKANTPGGLTLERHLTLPATLDLIDEGNWDVVVLQGQSLEAAMAEQPGKARENFLHGANGLYERIKAKSPRARVVLYQTWARHRDYWNEPPPFKHIGGNPAEMQALIRKWYQQAANGKKDCSVAPVGDAWERYYQDPKAPRLHDKDNSHPVLQGSYLAALVLYATIFRPAKLAIDYHGNLTAEQAVALQDIAREAATPVPRRGDTKA